MGVVQTSLLAYRSLDKINDKQKACYRVIMANGTISNYDIAKTLGWEINRVTPRVKELRERGNVEEAYKDTHPVTRRKVSYWRVT